MFILKIGYKKDTKLLNNFESFDNSETATKKDIVIQERVELVSSHMYKQFLDYQHSTVNTNDIFSRMIDCLELVADNLKQSWCYYSKYLCRIRCSKINCSS